MAVPVPEYLKQIAKVTKEKENEILMDIVCNCGCSDFYVYQNKKNPEKEKQEKELEQKLNKNSFSSLASWVDKTDGKRYVVKRNIFGKIILKIPESELQSGDYYNVIKIKCDKCEQEFIIFDNKKYGYDAFTNGVKDGDKLLEFTQKMFRSSTKNLVKIIIGIRNDQTYNDFSDCLDEKPTFEQYTNAFSDITIYGYIIDLDNKKTTIHTEETA